MQIMTSDSPSASPACDSPDIQNSPDCDCHFHVFSANESYSGARYQPAYAATIEDWTMRASNSGVGRGVVVQPSFLGTDNRMLLRTLQRAPDCLRGVAVVADDTSPSALQRLRDCGVRGVRLNLMGDYNDTDKLRALSSAWWTNLLATGLHLELHANVGRVATLLPMVPIELTVVLDHFGKPAAVRADDVTVETVGRRVRGGGTVYVTLSGAYRLGAGNAVTDNAKPGAQVRELTRLWLDSLGAEHLLWGSDWPCTNHEAHADYTGLRRQLDELVSDASSRVAILSANPSRLYWRE